MLHLENVGFSIMLEMYVPVMCKVYIYTECLFNFTSLSTHNLTCQIKEKSDRTVRALFISRP